MFARRGRVFTSLSVFHSLCGRPEHHRGRKSLGELGAEVGPPDPPFQGDREPTSALELEVLRVSFQFLGQGRRVQEVDYIPYPGSPGRVEVGGIVDELRDMYCLEGAFDVRMFVKNGPHNAFEGEVRIFPGDIHRNAEALDELALVICLEGLFREVIADADKMSSLEGMIR